MKIPLDKKECLTYEDRTYAKSCLCLNEGHWMTCDHFDKELKADITVINPQVKDVHVYRCDECLAKGDFLVIEVGR